MISFLVLLLSSPVLAQEWNYLGAPSPEPLRDIFFINEYVGWAVGGAFVGYPTFPSAVVYKTIDGGVTWTFQDVPTTAQLISAYFVNPAKGWVVGMNATILHTDDGGETWTEQPVPEDVAGVPLAGVAAMNEEVAWAVGWPGVIIKTVNGGGEWVELDSGTESNLQAIEMLSEDLGYVVGLDGLVLKTIDGGTSWDQQEQLRSSAGIPLSLNDIRCITDTNCKIAASNDYVCSTADGGEEWSCQVTGGIGTLNGIYFLNSEQGWATGRQIRSYDGGEWSLQTAEAALPTFLRAVQALESVCTDAGVIAYTVGDSSSGSGKVFRYGDLPLPPWPEEPVCDSGEPVILWGSDGCITGYECPEETRYRVVPPNRTRYAPAPPECPTIMDDCEAGYDPIFEYSANGCAVSYTCVNVNFEQESGFSSEKMSEFVAKVPGLSPNEKIIVYVTRADTSPLMLSFKLEEGQVVDIALKNQEDWTLKAETTEEILNKILAAEDPATEALAAINSKDIKLSGRTVGKKIKLAFLKMGLKLAGIFG